MNTKEFVIESNGIEGISRAPTDAEINEHDRFVNLPVVTLKDLERFVGIYQPDAELRDRFGLDVRVGNHVPVGGSPNMASWLIDLLDVADTKTPYELHVEYETLHPFTDGNGRSGRALWAWSMMQSIGHYRLGFLHQFYYQSLDAARQ